MRSFVLCFAFLFLLSSVSFAAKWQYVAIGDSYTIGTGVLPAKNWSTLLVNHLNFEGFKTNLLGNLGRNGWTSQDVLDYEIPVMNQLKPNLVTIMIGVNDWVQGVDPNIFRYNLRKIIEKVKLSVGDRGVVVVINIPDFSVTPFGRNFSYDRDIAKGIDSFNLIIDEVSKESKVSYIDVNSMSKKMGQDPQLIAADGLHPSEKSHLIWERVIYAEVMTHLK